MAEPLTTVQPEAGEQIVPENHPRSSRFPRGSLAKWVVLVVALLLVGGYWVWSYYSVRESTDDAQIQGHIHAISGRVGGTVTAVNIKDDQYVEAGAVLVQIDPQDYEVALQKAQADLADLQAKSAASQSDVPITAATTSSRLAAAKAGVQEARSDIASSEQEAAQATATLHAAQARVRETEANLTRAQRDLERMKQLIAKEEISQQQYDASVAAAESLRAAVDSSKANVNVAEEGLRVAQSHVERERARLAQSEAAVAAAETAPQQVAATKSLEQSAAATAQVARAASDQARLNVGYTTIRAPVAGVISKKNVEVGQIVQPGQPLFAIVPLEDIWVIANFKETQLNKIRPGQPATVSVDAYGGRKYKARVESIAAATGAEFSLLPPENATGNYVKVVQRVPVKIVFEGGQDPDHLLRPGMSVTPSVLTKPEK